MDYHMTATQNINLCLITFRIGQVYSIAQTRWEEVSASLEYLGQIQEIYLVSRQVVKCKEWVFGQRPKFPAAITTTGSIVRRVWFRWKTRVSWIFLGITNTWESFKGVMNVCENGTELNVILPLTWWLTVFVELYAHENKINTKPNELVVHRLLLICKKWQFREINV